jgi:SecD/SecF fusion protein
MILGVVFGTLSSIFIASPVAYLVLGRHLRNEEAQKQVEAATAAAPIDYKA